MFWFNGRFAIDVVGLIEAGKGGSAAAYVALNNCGGIAVAAAVLSRGRRTG